MFNVFGKKKEDNPAKEALVSMIKRIREKKHYVYSDTDLRGLAVYEDLKKRSPEELKEVVFLLTEMIGEMTLEQAQVRGKSGNSFRTESFPFYGHTIALALKTGLLRKKLNFEEEEWIRLFQAYKKSLDQVASYENFYFTIHRYPVNYAIKQIEYYLKKNELSEKLKDFIQEVLTWDAFANPNDRRYYGSDIRKTVKKLEELIRPEGEVPGFSLKTPDIGEAVNQIVGTIQDQASAFYHIFNLATGASSSKPSKKFSEAVKKHQDLIGLEAYKLIAHQVLETVIALDPSEQTHTYQYSGQEYQYTEYLYLSAPSQQFIKGMVWTMERFSDKETIRILSKVCEKAYAKIPGRGPAAASVGNACVYILGTMRGKDGLGALSRLKLKIRQNNVKKAIDKHLQEGAKRYHVSVEELKEMAVPDFNLEKGRKTLAFEEYRLEISIQGSKVVQQWINPEGKAMKSVPSAVKKSTALTKKLNEARKEVKEMQKVFSAQKQRIDNQFILDRRWDYPAFQKYYIDHGLVHPISTQLIWIFSKGDVSAEAIYLDGNWYTREHDLLDWIDGEAQVKLWHPVHADEASILAWREKMIDLEWKQPIKQAFREIYILTDAEVNTRVYSNRMAAHILKQHQFNTLANLRGWKYSLLGAYDDGRDNETCHKYLPEHKIQAEYWIDELDLDDAFNDTGIWYYIATDQVKFKDENGQAMDLVQVPKIVFTEIMRDVDMFVGVCSVGNDPQWMDNNGERQANRDYWNSYSFGDLNEIAKTRKTILERLLPRLKKIRDKARIDGKFLIVEGKLRTYKIHMGSGNILMEPNDQYLCIVPARSAENATDKVFIPFDGDKGLSIVLSKAFLLAEDEKISDSTITSQINRQI